MVEPSPSPSPSPAEGNSSIAAAAAAAAATSRSGSGSGEGKPAVAAGGDRIQRQSPDIKKKSKNSITSAASSSRKNSKKKAEDGKWKVCKGYLYFSSRLQSHGRTPSCIGTQKPLPRVSASMSKRYKVVAAREGNLSYFKYACVGYSLFSGAEDSSTEAKNEPASLPVCAGYELLLGKKTSSQAPSRANRKQYKEDLYFLRSRTTSKELARKTFVGRFARSAELVAAGVARNLLKAGSYIKDNLDNMLYPDRRRPK